MEQAPESRPSSWLGRVAQRRHALETPKFGVAPFEQRMPLEVKTAQVFRHIIGCPTGRHFSVEPVCSYGSEASVKLVHSRDHGKDDWIEESHWGRFLGLLEACAPDGSVHHESSSLSFRSIGDMHKALDTLAQRKIDTPKWVMWSDLDTPRGR